MSTDVGWRTGKVCYLELPAADPSAAAEFYRAVFGWRIRQRGDGSVAFDDTTGAVSGAFVAGRPPADDARLLVYVMVADLPAATAAIVAAGGRVVRVSDAEHGEVFAHVADPHGNVLGVYEQPGLAQDESDGPSMTSIEPELWVDRPGAAIDFYTAAFGADTVHLVGEGDDIVARLGVGAARFWVTSTSPAMGRLSPKVAGGTTGRTLLVVSHPGAVVARAVAEGATETAPVVEEYGWVLGRIVDPFGHEWEIGTPLAAQEDETAKSR
jgi:predicted enzyme related to lactoylglutathione lyase